MTYILKHLRQSAVLAGVAISVLSATSAGAEDALFIDKDGIHAGANLHMDGSLNFGNRTAPLITLWDPYYVVGIQDWSMYFRTDRNFVWYRGGSHSATALDAGTGGTTLMSLSSAPAKGKGTLDVNGLITGKGAVPIGAILMWSGNPASLPAGWVLCDGQNNTPNLSGRFVVGYQANKPDYAMKQTGGEEKHTLTVAEMPSHNHGAAGEHTHKISASQGGWAFDLVQSGDIHKTPIFKTKTDADGIHTHNSEGGGQPHENRPPYFTLAYIMFTGK